MGDAMRRLFTPFRRLSWKLTLSYTLVTVGALLVTEALALVLLQVFVFGGDLIPRTIAQVFVAEAAPQVRPFLDRPEPDLAGLNTWLQDVAINGVRTGGGQGGRVQMSPGTFSAGGEDGYLMVLDGEQRVLAALPRDADLPAGQPVDAARFTGLAQLLPLAMAGEQRVESLYVHSPDGTFVVAAPVRAADGHVAGVLVASGKMLRSEDYLMGYLSFLATSAVVFTVAAGLAGTLFGFITARGLTRRLRAVAQTAAGWGRGEFSRQIADRSGDEIGQLGQTLNTMAHELDGLVETRQQLATLEERNRLARDLHDSVKQQVFAITMNLGTAQALWERDPATARARLDTAAALARDAQRELGALIQALRPLELQGQGLVQGLREYAQAWEKQTGIATIYQVQGASAVPLAVEQALFRVGQEALSNIARHSGAKAATLTLTLGAAGVDVQLRDNGRGFDPRQPPKGLGLRSMQERVVALGGTFGVESSAQGTCLSVRVPL